MNDPRVTQLTHITIGTMNLDRDPGVVLRAVELHHHPERIKLELKHREENPGAGYNPFAGPYDLTVVRVDKFIQFVQNKVIKEIKVLVLKDKCFCHNR